MNHTYCIDVDGCLADFNTAFGRLMEQVSYDQVTVPRTPPTKWNWIEDYHKDVVNDAWKYVKTSGVFWRDLMSLPGTDWMLERLNDLSKAGHCVYFVTSRPGHRAKIQTEEWLEAYGAVRPTVLISHDKGHTARGLHAHMFVDDKPENHLDVLRQCGSSCRCVLLDQPWNQDWNHPYVTRVFSLDLAL